MKALILAYLWSRHSYKTFDEFFFHEGFVQPAELFRLCFVLDGSRLVKQLGNKIKRYENDEKFKKRRKLESQIFNIKEQSIGNLTSSIIKRIKKFVATIPESDLIHYLIYFPMEKWQALADLCHLKSSDFQLPYFLPCIYGEQAPESSIVHQMNNLTSDNLYEYLCASENQFDFSFVREKVKNGSLYLKPEVKTKLASVLPLTQALLHFRTIESGDAAQKLSKRIKEAGNVEGISYPVLMKMIIDYQHDFPELSKALIPAASSSLPLFLEDAEGLQDFTVAVFGDASPSMRIAIKVAAIVGNVLCTALKGELSFFAGKVIDSPIKTPNSVTDVMKVVNHINEQSFTCPAACLLPYYEQKKKMDLIVVVADEEENTPVKLNSQNTSFCDLFIKYQKEVNQNCKLFFVSFMEFGNMNYQMQHALQKRGIDTKF